jgi:hypothetical protein
MAGVLAIAIAGALGWWLASSPQCEAVNSDPDAVTLNVAQLGQGSTRKYCVRVPSRVTVRLIVGRGYDGKVRVVLDACRACYLHGLGYRLSGRRIMCRFCSNQYSIDALSAGLASCSPFSLPFRERAGTLTIKRSDLESGERLFPKPAFARGPLAPILDWFARLLQRRDRGSEMLSSGDGQWPARNTGS